MTIVTNDENNNKTKSSFYLLESCDVWHDMLGCVNYNFMQRLINHKLLPSMVFFRKIKNVKFI